MADEAQTRPTLETVLERINALGQQLHGEMAVLRKELHTFREQMEIRLDRIEGGVKLTHSELYYLRPDFKELRSEFYEFRAQFKQPA